MTDMLPWHMGTHLRVLSEGYQMNTNIAEFRLFSKIFAFYAFFFECSLSNGKGNSYNTL